MAKISNIKEEQILRAAKANDKLYERQASFAAGVKWFRGNIWHGKDDEPQQECGYILAYMIGYGYNILFGHSGWLMNYQMIERWCYIDDLYNKI